MELLFDISPEEPTRSRHARAKPRPAEASEPNEIRAIQKTCVLPPLGRLTECVECIDQTCQAACHDIVCEEGREWFLECCFCGTGQWIKAIPGHLKPREGKFTFRDGRFSGLTIDEAAAQPKGLDYIAWAAAEHKRSAVKDACKKWIDDRGARS